MDGRQDERAEVYERGPGSEWSGADVVGALQKADLYPHGVHVVHEGDSEQIVIEALLASLLGAGMLEEVNFTDLEAPATPALSPTSSVPWMAMRDESSSSSTARPGLVSTSKR